MNLLGAFLSVSGWTLVSRIVGLVRDVIIAATFGAGALVDAFFAAFRLPNTLRRFTAEGALTQAFVPAYKDARRQNPDEAAAFAGNLLFLLAASLSALAALVVLAAPAVIALLAPGLKEAELAAAMLRIVFPYIVLISIVALFAGILNADSRFRAAAAAPVLLNLCLIAAAWWLAPLMMEPITALAWGVLAGGILQTAFIGICVWRARLWPQIRPHRPDARIFRALSKMGQSSLGAGATQINLLINLALASLLPAGSISWLYYADRLMELPAGLLGAALATVVLPALSGSLPQQANKILDEALRLVLLLAAPAAVGMALLATPTVRTLFAYGAFTANDVAMTARAVIAYSAGTIGLVAIRPLAAAFFSRGDAATPAKTATAMLLATQLMNGLFVFLLQWNHAGIALSIGLAATFNAVLLWWLLRRRGWYVPQPGWGRLMGVTAAALAAMAAALWLMQPAVEFWNGAWGVRILALSGLLALAIAVYFIVLRLGGIKLSDFQRNL